MEIGNKILVFVALFGIISLFLLFTGSASAAVDFPADEAGISAYVKAKSSVNLVTVKPALATIERETDDYIIGTVDLPWHSEEQDPLVYVSTDGWVVAYYPRDRSSGWLLPWYYYSGGPISTTTLRKAVGKVCDQIGGTTTGLKYYDFRYPDATKMMIIVESVDEGRNFFKVTIPTNFTVYKVDWSHYADTRQKWCDGWSKVKLDGVAFSSFGGCRCYNYGSLLGQFENGIEHKIEIEAHCGSGGRVGLVLEYAE